MHPGQPGSLPVLGEEEETSRTRRVFLTSSPNEDFFWAVGSISFVIDAGLEKRYVSVRVSAGWLVCQQGVTKKLVNKTKTGNSTVKLKHRE